MRRTLFFPIPVPSRHLQLPEETATRTRAVFGPLNDRYTFDRFVIGTGNQFAHAASVAVANEPGNELQPPLHLRRRRPGEDAPAARHRKRGAGEVPAPEGVLHPRREVHQRPHRLPALRKDVRLQGAIPERRPAADGRRAVHRGEAKHPGGVLPHLQRAVLLPPAGRGVQRQVPQGDPRPRGADPVALRVGPRRRYPGARHRDAGSDPQPEGGSGKHRPCRKTWRCTWRPW